MFDFHSPTAYLWLGLAALVIGFGWAFGGWLFAQLTRPRRNI